MIQAAQTLFFFGMTILFFLLMRRLCLRFKHPLMNPLLLTVALIIPILLSLHISYEHYFSGSLWIHQMLQPAVVALAFPLYKQLPHIIRHWRIILLAGFTGSLMAMFSGVGIALALGASEEIAASVLAKSVTTPIALTITEQVGGIGAITAACVIVVGILGAVFAYPIMNILKIKHKMARGMGMGAAAHALGTARATEMDLQEGAFSSLALVLCGVITALIAPFLYPYLLQWFAG